LRREREDRERPRSRVRDSSRQRRDASPRRDRELDRDRDRDRDEHRRRDDRKDDHIRRDRDVERDNYDDPRRWRDDGRRDERMAARREFRDKEYRDREREREKERGSRVSERDSNWDSDRPRDRDRDRWGPDERDSRSKRSNGRDRRGHSRDEDRDGKDRDDRKDSKARVEEKEPAWMDAYIPSESGAGILGGKAENGELDSIQAWKLGMKEKERKERESEALGTSGDAEQTGSAKLPEAQATPPTEPPLDEIQLFKLMIKREGEKSKMASLRDDPAIAYLGPGNDSGGYLACAAPEYS
jgi:zinc finger CCCH domain-containing protein 13